MKKRQYRMCKRKEGYYPQTRYKWLLFWMPWMRIGKHNDGFGLYAIDDYAYPHPTLESAEKVIFDYKVWVKTVGNPSRYLYGY
jgi:hypothetical protein